MAVGVQCYVCSKRCMVLEKQRRLEEKEKEKEKKKKKKKKRKHIRSGSEPC